MTEQTLGEAIKIKRQIDHLRERKAEVEKVRAWCKEGNASFKIQTTEAGFSRDGVTISGATTKLVLDKELEEIKKENVLSAERRCRRAGRKYAQTVWLKSRTKKPQRNCGI